MKTCPNCGRTSNQNKFFCDACAEPLFEGTGLGTGGSMPQDPPAPPAFGQPYPAPGYPPPGYPPTNGYVAASPGRRKRRYGGWIGMIVAACIVLAVGAIVVINLTRPRIKVDPPPGWNRASEAEREEFDKEMGEDGSTIELFLPQNGSASRIAIGRVSSEPMGDLPDTGDLNRMKEYLAENRGGIEDEFGKEGVTITGMEARQLNCGQSAVYISLGMSANGVYVAEDIILLKKDSTMFMVVVANGSGSSNMSEVLYLLQNITLE